MACVQRFLISALLLVSPPALAQEGEVTPPDASEFTTLPELSGSVTVGAASPVAGVAEETPAGMPVDTEVETLKMLQPQPGQMPFAPASDPAAPPNALPADTAALPPPPAEAPPPTNTVVLQGLNKVTGHISKLEGPIGTVLTFDNLEIITRRCWKSPADERPENAALLEIRELKIGEAPRKVFMGWMFSSSPGLSGLEHPVYDIAITACEFRENPESLPEPQQDQPRTTPKTAPKTMPLASPRKARKK